MKRYIASNESESLTSILGSSTISDLSTDVLLDIYNKYHLPNDMYGSFNDTTELSRFFCILDELEERGYEV